VSAGVVQEVDAPVTDEPVLRPELEQDGISIAPRAEDCQVTADTNQPVPIITDRTVTIFPGDGAEWFPQIPIFREMHNGMTRSSLERLPEPLRV